MATAQYFRAFLPRLLAIALCAVLAACAGRPGPEALVAAVSADGAGKLVSIYVATTRKAETKDSQVSGVGRAVSLTYARYVISLPPGHKQSQIEWPAGGVVNPATSFAVISAAPLSEAAFAAAVAATPKLETGRRVAGVFVHGYNNTFQEGVFRMAQLVADSGYGGAPVLFSWPSKGALNGYLADREAATASRDGLAQVLGLLTGLRSLDDVGLMGHSMGGWLTAETLRALRLSGKHSVIARLRPVVLAAPDIDLDVFRSQIGVIGTLNPPLTVLVSKDDGALSISARLAASEQRLGNVDVTDAHVRAAAAALNIQVIDISSVAVDDPLHHSRYLGSYRLLREIARSGADKPPENPLRQAGTFVLDTVGAVVNP